MRYQKHASQWALNRDHLDRLFLIIAKKKSEYRSVPLSHHPKDQHRHGQRHCAILRQQLQLVRNARQTQQAQYFQQLNIIQAAAQNGFVIGKLEHNCEDVDCKQKERNNFGKWLKDNVPGMAAKRSTENHDLK